MSGLLLLFVLILLGFILLVSGLLEMTLYRYMMPNCNISVLHGLPGAISTLRGTLQGGGE